jgi:hypothetical protein
MAVVRNAVNRPLAAWSSVASTSSLGDNTWWVTGSSTTGMWVAQSRQNLYVEANTAVQDKRWFTQPPVVGVPGGGEIIDLVGVIAIANRNFTGITDGGGSDAKISVSGFNITLSAGTTDNNFVDLAEYLAGTSFASWGAATEGMVLRGYYYNYVTNTASTSVQEYPLNGVNAPS